MTSKDPSGKRGRVRSLLRRHPISMLVVAVIVAGGAFFVIAPLNVAARIGPYTGVGWVLHTYMKNWARTWSFAVEKPDFLDISDPALVRLGAGYFESGCAPCHGTPDRDRNPMVEMMEPPPPALESQVGNFSDKALYWIVWNGVRYTAMPGWTGEHRNDEVWAMVAFLRQYSTMEPQEYLRLAYGEVHPKGGAGGRMSFGGLMDRLDRPVQNCVRCHGVDGMGRDGTAPKIAGQSVEYLSATLRGYASGQRPSGFMQPIAASLSDDEISTLSSHFAEMRPVRTGTGKPQRGSPDTTEYEQLKILGERLASTGDPAHFIPSCNSCHVDGGGVSPRAEYPRIAGQESRFITAWLRLYRDRPIGGTKFADVMHVAAKGLGDHDIDALAAWYSSQPYDAAAHDAKRADAGGGGGTVAAQQ